MSSRKANEYRSGVKPIWCPGCGDYAVLNALMRAFAELSLPNEDIVVASGIGCSSRFPAFIKTYGIHGVHGRPLPLATGAKLGNPALTVVAVGGDGDGFSIGAGHIPHAARRNVDITYIVMDNNIYGMTKGQPSPTSPQQMKRKASPYGAQERPLNPMMMALSYETSFVARAFSGKLREMAAIFKAAISHPGFSFVQVLSPCITFHNTYDHYREITQPMPETHNLEDLSAAMQLAMDEATQYIGIFYQEKTRPSYSQRFNEMRKTTPQMTFEGILESFHA